MARGQNEETAGVDVLEIHVPGSEPVGQLPPTDWLLDPDTQALVAALTAEGGEVRFVGGCVRDAIAHRPVKDIDLATPLPPDDIMRLAEAAGLRAIPTGIDHGTVTVLSGDRTFEVTTLRRDVKTDGRHATVAFTNDWLEDAKRRDFTINALSCTLDGAVYDPFDGIPDLAHGRIRFIGRPEERIEEDYLRILRFFRFQASYGRPPTDKLALGAIRTHAARLDGISGERVRDELLKIVISPQPAEIFILMRGNEVLQRILPEAGDPNRLRAISWLTTRALVMESVQPDALVRLAALLDPAGGADAASALAGRLRLSNQDTDRLVRLVSPPFRLQPRIAERELKALLYRFGTEAVRDTALITWAGEIGLRAHLPSNETQGWIKILETAEYWQTPVFPLRGQDLLDAGMTAGPKIGKVLKEVEDWWIENDFQADRDACLVQALGTSKND